MTKTIQDSYSYPLSINDLMKVIKDLRKDYINKHGVKPVNISMWNYGLATTIELS